MNAILSFVINNKDAIFVDIIGGLILAFLLGMVAIIKKRLSPKPLPVPEEQAIYLNMPKRSFDDNCIGRYDLLEEVFNKIIDSGKNFLTRKCIAITGVEGIGKSLFCYTLFQYDLKNYSVYLGWIDCNGEQSIFDIIKTTFKDPRFQRKSKDDILNAFNSMNKPCILFADQVDRYTPIDELEELSHCHNVILILSGLFKEINFANYSFELQPLSKEVIYMIFKKYSDEDIDFLIGKNKKSVESLLENYAIGNPFLTIAFAKAKYHYNGRWEEVLKRMERLEYSYDDNYLRNILKQLYKIRELSCSERTALSKLSIVQYLDFTNSVFELLNISDDCVKSLCKTYWITQNDSIVYSMDKTHCDVITKVLMFRTNLEEAIESINKFMSVWEDEDKYEFKWISLYVEDILKEVQGFAVHIMEEEFFAEFAYNIASKYSDVYNDEKCLDWLDLCKPKNAELLYNKLRIEFQTKYQFVNKLFSFSEIEQLYLDVLEQAKVFDDFENKKRYLMQEYCNFLSYNKQYCDAVLLCEEYFKTYSMDLSDRYNCDMFFRYLSAANNLDDKESLERLVTETTIQSLYQNEKVSISAAWCFGTLGAIYKKWGDKEKSDKYTRHMVILITEQEGFFDIVIKHYLQISEEEFAEYMHSCDELRDSLDKALERRDVDALYIEGRYQEKCNNFDAAFALYEEAAARDSLRGMCSLALLYYRGQGKPRNYGKARRYWEYCCERGHRGSYYWLSILLLDTDYSRSSQDYDKDRELALDYLTKAAELGSERAKQKLLEL